MPQQYNPTAVYDAVCRSLAIPARPDLRSLLSHPSPTFSASSRRLSDHQAIALCTAYLASYGAPAALLRRFVSAYNYVRFLIPVLYQESVNNLLLFLPDSLPAVPNLSHYPPCLTLDFSNNPLLTSYAANAILALSLILPVPAYVELDLHNCAKVSNLSLIPYRSLILSERQKPYPISKVCGLQLDATDIRLFDLETLDLLRDLRWISLRCTAIRNLWRGSEIFNSLPNLTAALISGAATTVEGRRQLEEIRHLSRRELLKSPAAPHPSLSPTTASAISAAVVTAAALAPPQSSPPIDWVAELRSSLSQHSLADILQTADLRKPVQLAQRDVPAFDLANQAQLRAQSPDLDHVPQTVIPIPANATNTVGTVPPATVNASSVEQLQAYFRHMQETPVSRAPSFRDFILASARDSLRILDGASVSARDRKDAASRLVDQYEEVGLGQGTSHRTSIPQMLRARELGMSLPFHGPMKANKGGLDIRDKKRRRTATAYSPRVSNIMAAVTAAGFPSVRWSGRTAGVTGGKWTSVADQETDEVMTSPRQMSPERDCDARFKTRAGGVRLRNYVERDFAMGMSSALIRRPGAPRIQYLNHVRDRPRQFEYNPAKPSEVVYGTDHGHIVVMDQETGEVKGSCLSGGGSGIRPTGQVIPRRLSLDDVAVVNTNGNVNANGAGGVQAAPVYGLSWLNKRSDMFLSGSNDGSIHVYNVNWMRSGERGGCMYACDSFDQLTSLHVSCDDTKFAVSGNQQHVGLYDLGTGRRIELMQGCHRKSINVIKFAHTSPHVLVTSSFDRYVKKWDLRESRRGGGGRRPIFQASSRTDNVMACFSPDDSRLLVSAVDNEVRQFLASDGQLEREFNIPKKASCLNFTRSYYMNDRDYIITGSCMESVVRVYNSKTGAMLTEVDMDNRQGIVGKAVFVQSLRANPHRNFNFSVLLTSSREVMNLGLIANADMHWR